MERYTYLILILIWAGPPILLQWLLGGDLLLQRWKVILIGALVPTAYLIALDALAVTNQIWTLNPTLSTGIRLPVLDATLEEALLFLLTNLLLAQTVVLMMAFDYMRHRIAMLVRMAWQLVRRGKIKPPDAAA
jgi:lycopene cyclase domain-containing protein